MEPEVRTDTCGVAARFTCFLLFSVSIIGGNWIIACKNRIEQRARCELRLISVSRKGVKFACDSNLATHEFYTNYRQYCCN